MAGHSNPPDLNAVLQTLSSLASQGSSSEISQPISLQPHASRPSRAEPSHTPRPVHSNPPKPSTPTIDPSTITTWPAALRYVMRTVGQNEETQLRIRGLIRSQHSHERQWWKGREALLQRQGARGDKQKELDAVLRSIGAPVESKETSTTEEDQAELKNYDAKIYKASMQMADALTAELRGHQIPFFVLKKSLVQDSTSSADLDGTPGMDQKLSKPDLIELQRRMLQLLEDLCKE
ncbi:uncharacterized protein N7484_001977 [Penicillium longicatenatum]|uniref:uncharacterized protein n=1 Tax=Penicillium longicatenatum TaxID=1561947 RepID=UPI00254769AB|nr:uncharacterized protein N7484_001977 [Penicillium longicatenatum]KAJ5658328.1 hypothetical protein N7484_001977 [Penicillium longicatenatum]